MEYITLVTESGKWKRRVRRDDVLFSSLIPDLDDLPDELPLSGSVAEILEEEWKYYEELEKAHKEVMRHLTMLETGMKKDKTMSMISLTHCVLTYMANGGNVVAYSSISRLMMLLNIPQRFLPYIYLDERVLPRDHYIHNTSIASSISLQRFFHHASDNILNTFINIMDIDDDPWSRFILSQYHNAELSAFLLGRKPSLYDINWDITLQVINESEEGMKQVYNKDCISAILGKGVELFTNLYPLDMPIYRTTGASLTYDIPDMSVSDLSRLYDSLLTCHPDNVNPHSLGLAPIIVGKWHHVHSNILTRVHERYFDVLIPKGRTLTMKLFPYLIELYSMTIVGREGMRRILLSFLHYMPSMTCDKQIRRVDYFCKLIEERLDKNDVGGKVERLVSRDMLDEIEL